MQKYLAKVIIFGLAGLLVLLGVQAIYQSQSPRSETVLACDSQSQQKTECESDAVLAEVRTHGLKTGFELLRKFYDEDPLLRADCHAIAMRIGRETNQEFPDYRKLSLTPESALCNYGFYQEYPYALVLKTGDVSAAGEFCEYAADELGGAVPGLRAECFRGIGRALPFMRQADLGDIRKMASFAIDTCKNITPDKDEHTACLAGSFNQLGRNEAVSKTYLAAKRPDPLWLCREQAEWEASMQCYGNFKWVVVNALPAGDFKSMFQAFARSYPEAPDISAIPVAWTLAYEEARKDVGKKNLPALAVEACASLPSRFRADCVSGWSVGIAKHGTPGKQHLALISFCKEVTQSIHEGECPSRQAIEYLRGFYAENQFKEACSALRKELGAIC